MKSLVRTLTALGLCTFLFTAQLAAQNHSFQNTLLEPSIFTIDNIHLNRGCTNKAAIPIKMPKGAKGCFYSITIAPKKQVLNPSFTLLNQVKKLDQEVEFDHIIDFIRPELTEKVCNIYLITGKENIDLFVDCKYLKPAPAFIQSKSRSGYIENKGDGETVYLGFENPYASGKSIQLRVEIVAVTGH